MDWAIYKILTSSRVHVSPSELDRMSIVDIWEMGAVIDSLEAAEALSIAKARAK